MQVVQRKILEQLQYKSAVDLHMEQVYVDWSSDIYGLLIKLVLIRIFNRSLNMLVVVYNYESETLQQALFWT